jgi:hypothetical protein
VSSVVHCKKAPFNVYIGRPSQWGNPFTIGKDGTREEVIAKYREWISDQPLMIARLRNLKGKILGCWCHPKPCHGDVLIELIKLHRAGLFIPSCINGDSTMLRLYGTVQGWLPLHRMDHRPNVTHQGPQRRQRSEVLSVPIPGDAGVRAGMPVDERSTDFGGCH